MNSEQRFTTWEKFKQLHDKKIERLKNIQTKINLKIINDLLNKFNSEFNRDRLLVYKL